MDKCILSVFLLLSSCAEFKCDYTVRGLCVTDRMDVGEETTRELIEFFVAYQEEYGYFGSGWAAYTLSTSHLIWCGEMWSGDKRYAGFTYPMWYIQVWVDMSLLSREQAYLSALFHELFHAMAYRKWGEGDNDHSRPFWGQEKRMKEYWANGY